MDQQQQQQQYGGVQYPPQQYNYAQQQPQYPSYPQYSAPPPQQAYGAPAAAAPGGQYNDGYRQAVNDLSSGRGGSMMGQLGMTALNAGIFLGLPVYLMYRFSKGGGVPGGGGSKAISEMMEKMNPVQKRNFRMEVKNVKFADIIGVPEAKSEVKQYVDFLKSPDRFTTLGARMPRGALLTGKPGTGKTLLAKAVAGEAEVPFFSCSGADFIEIFGGSGPKRVRELFTAAKEAAPAVIFIDELDSVGSKRSGDQGIGGEENRTTNALLAEMDGMGTNDGVVVFAATNFPEHLDSALTRPGRFDRKVEIPVPDEEARKDLFEYYLQKITTAVSFDSKVGDLKKKVEAAKADLEKKRNAPDIAEKKKRLAEHRAELEKLCSDADAKNKETREKDLATKVRQLQKDVGENDVYEPNFTPPTAEELAEGQKLAAELASRTPGVTPASIATIANESALVAAEKGASFVRPEDINDAIDNVLIGKKHRSRMSDHGLRRTSYHEAGHAVVQWYCGTQTPVLKVSVIPRGKAGGYTQFKGSEELDPQTDTFLYEQLLVLLAGRNAERIFFGDFSTGARDDLQRAFQSAKAQVQHYGMSKEFGPMAIDPASEQRGRGASQMSEQLQHKVEAEAKLIVEKADADCIALLKQYQGKMEELANKIYEDKEINEDQVRAILGNKVVSAKPTVKMAMA